jgi:voltage-gated potassium channel Kch
MIEFQTLSDWRKRYDCRPAKFSCDKDAPFEPDPGAETDCAAAPNGRSRLAKDRRLRLRISAVGFLAALVLMLVATPFVQGFEEGQLYEAVLFTLVMCTGLIASGSCRRLAFALVSFALAAIWLNQIWPKRCPALTFILPAMAFLGVVIASLLGFILRAKRVDANVLCAGISVYLILGLLWGLAYTLVAEVNPNAFAFNPHPGAAATMSGFTAIYFSFTTLATLGYGDITPAADAARMLAMLEAMTGTLFVGVMIARLVSLYSASGQRHTPPHNQSQSNYS